MSRLNLSDFLNQRRLDRNIERVATGHERAPMAAEDLFDVITAPRGWSQSTPDALTSAGIDPDDLLAVSGAWDPSATAGSWFEQFGGLEETQRDVQQHLERPAERWFAPQFDVPELAARAEQAQQQMAAGASEGDGSTTWDDIRDRYEDGDLGVADPQAQGPGVDTMLGGMVGSETERTAEQRDGFWSNALDSWTGHVESGRGPAKLFDPVSGLLGDRAGDATRRVARSLRDRTGNLASGDGFVPTQLPQMQRLMLEIEDGTFTPESEEELDSIIERGQASERELAALQSVIERAEIRGMDTDRGDGLLIRAIETLQRPQSALVGLTAGLAGEEGLDEQDEVAESGLESNVEVGLSRFLRGWTGDRVDMPSNYTPWDTDEMDWEGSRTVGHVPVNARLARGTAHTADFISNVIGDPISYLTFGAGGLTRKASSELASRAIVPTAQRAGRGQLTSLSPQGKRALVEHAGPDPSFVDTVTTWANRGNVQLGRQGDRVVASAVPEGQAARNTTNTVAEALWRESDGVMQLDRWGAYQALEPIIGNQFTQEFLERGLAQMAGGVRQGHGATGLRRQLTEVFGDDTVFDALPGSVRGGLQVTVPFVTKRTDFGTDMRWSFELTKGGGRNPLARASADWYNKARRGVAGSPTGAWWQGMFGGRATAGLQDMSQALLRGDEKIAGRAWTHFQAVQDNFVESGARRRRLADQAKNTAQAADVHLRQATDYDQARDALRTVFAARGSRTLDPKTGQLINPDGSLSGTVAEGITPLSSLPADAAEAAEGAMQTFALHMDDLIQGIRRLGDVGYLGPDYTPRVFADQMDDMLQAGGSRFTISRSGNYATHRISGTGNVETSSWLSAVEVRQEAARRGDTGVAFVDNPLEAMTDYIDAASRLTDRMHTLDGFRRAGLVIDVTPTDVRAYTDAGARGLLQEAASNLGGVGNAVRRLKEAVGKGDDKAMREAFGPLADRVGRDRAQGILDAASSVQVRRTDGARRAATAATDEDLAADLAGEMAREAGAPRVRPRAETPPPSTKTAEDIRAEYPRAKVAVKGLNSYEHIQLSDDMANALAALPDPAPGMQRLYRARSATNELVEEGGAIDLTGRGPQVDGAVGRWFTDDPRVSLFYAASRKDGDIVYVDVPASLRGSSELTHPTSDIPHVEWVLPAEDVRRARPVLQDAAPEPRTVADRAPAQWQAVDSNGRVLETFETEKAAQLFTNRTNHIRGSNRLASEIERELFADRETLNRLLDYRNIPVDNEQAFRQHIESISNRVGQWLNDADPERVRNILTQPSSAPTKYREMVAAQPGWRDLPPEAKDAASARMLAESGAFSTEAVIQTLARYNQPPGKFAEGYAKLIQPAYLLFKNYATIGSGPRFAVRNAVGGHWQSWVQGVTPKYAWRGLRMMMIEEKSKRAVRSAAGKAGETVNRQQLVERTQAEVRRRMVSRWGDVEGARLADALDLFYERNLMTGSRTDDLFAPVLDGRSVTGGDVLGGEFTSRMRGGPQAGGLGETGLSQARGWRRVLESEGQYADQMDPALRRLAGMESTVFAGRGRTDLLEGAAEGATRRERAAAAMRRGAQEAQDNPYIRMGASMAEMSEKWTRIAPFLKGLDDYGIEDGGRAAGLIVKAGQFDYGDLTEFERKIMRQVFPFYTFTRNNVPFQLRALAHSPDKIAKLGHAHNQMEEATGDEDWHKSLYVRWVRDNMGVVTEWRPSDAPDWLKNIPLAGALFQSQDPLAWNLSSLPAMDLNKLLGPSGRDELIGMANPLFKTALEHLTGIDSFSKGDLPEEERVEWAADWARHLPGFSRDDSGDINVSTYLSRPLRNSIPPVGMAERLLGSTERYDNRKLTSWASTMFGLPVSTLDEFQVTNHVRRETRRISDRLSRQLGDDITPSQLDRLVEAGIPSDVIVGAAEDGELPQLFELLDIYEAGQEEGDD